MPAAIARPRPGSAALEFGPARGVQFHLADLVQFLEDHFLVGVVDPDAGILDADLAHTRRALL